MNWKKIWHFLWKEESAASWMVNVILAFVIIKFLVYPGLGLILGTSYPVVAVVSESMEHDITEEYRLIVQGSEVMRENTGKYTMCGNTYDEDRRVTFDVFWDECGAWYEERGIDKETFDTFTLSDGFNKGDIIMLVGGEVKQGDVIVFWSGRPEPIIHRVVEVEEGRYLTKGDHNGKEDGWVDEDKVIGKALLRVPFFGWIKIWFVSLLGVFI